MSRLAVCVREYPRRHPGCRRFRPERCSDKSDTSKTSSLATRTGAGAWRRDEAAGPQAAVPLRAEDLEVSRRFRAAWRYVSRDAAPARYCGATCFTSRVVTSRGEPSRDVARGSDIGRQHARPTSPHAMRENRSTARVRAGRPGSECGATLIRPWPVARGGSARLRSSMGQQTRSSAPRYACCGGECCGPSPSRARARDRARSVHRSFRGALPRFQRCETCVRADAEAVCLNAPHQQCTQYPAHILALLLSAARPCTSNETGRYRER